MKRAVGETADEVWCPVCENVGWSPIDGDYTCPLCHTVVRMTLTDGIVGYQETQPRAAWRHLVDPDPTPAVNRRPVGATVNQRVVARECLIALAVFVGSLFVVIPVAALLMEPSQSVTEFVGNASGFYSDFVAGELFDEPRLWAFLLVPYVIIQVGRSVVWSVKRLRG